MPKIEDIRKRAKENKAFLHGERIFGIKFRHNSQVAYTGTDGTRYVGWIVAVGPLKPEPIYTVERGSGLSDVEVNESSLELVFDPHENRGA